MKRIYSTRKHLEEINTRVIEMMRERYGSEGTEYNTVGNDERGEYLDIEEDDHRQPLSVFAMKELSMLVDVKEPEPEVPVIIEEETLTPQTYDMD